MTSQFSARARDLEARVLDLARDRAREITASTSHDALRACAWCAEVSADDPMDAALQPCVDHAFTRAIMTLVRESQAAQVAPMRFVSGAPRSPIDDDEMFEKDSEAAFSQSSVARVLDIALTLAESCGIASSALFTMYEMVTEACTVRGARDVVIWLRERRERVKAPGVWKYGKLTILRTFIALMKRCMGRGMLEADVHGRALLLLSGLNGFFDRSGMNLSGAVSTQTTEIFGQEEWVREDDDFPPDAGTHEEEKDVKMDTDVADVDDAGDADDVVIDNDSDVSWVTDAFHHTFWSIQEFFQNPPATMTKDGGWNRFHEILMVILNAFEAHPLGESALDLGIHPGSELSKKIGLRFLTARRLLPLQMKDYQFRRQILIQAAFFLHFCNDPKYAERQKEKKQELKVVDEEVTEAAERVMKILQRTGPRAKEAAEFVEVALLDETQWVDWKMKGCPNFVKEPIEDFSKMPLPENYDVSKSKWPPDMYPPDDPNVKFDTGDEKMTRLWNLSADGETSIESAALKAPTLEEFFAPCLEEMDPEAQIEPEYRRVNDKAFEWRAMRLLATNHMHLFAKIATDGLESVIPEILGVPDPRPPELIAKENDAKKTSNDKAKAEGSNATHNQEDILNAHVEELDGAIEPIDGDHGDDDLPPPEPKDADTANAVIDDAMEADGGDGGDASASPEPQKSSPARVRTPEESKSASPATGEPKAKTAEDQSKPLPPTQSAPQSSSPAPAARTTQSERRGVDGGRGRGGRGGRVGGRGGRGGRDQDRGRDMDRGGRGGRSARDHSRDARPPAPVPQPPVPAPRQHQPVARQRYNDRRGSGSGGARHGPRYDDRAPPPQRVNRPPPPPAAARPDTNLGKRRRDGEDDQAPHDGGHQRARARGNQGQRYNRNRNNNNNRR